MTRPTLPVLRDQLISSIEASIGQKVPSLPKSFYRVLATAVAGVVALLYRYLAWINDQIYPQSASEEMLIKQGYQWGIDRLPPMAYRGTALVRGTSGAASPAGTIWAGNGQLYMQADLCTVGSMCTIECVTTGLATTLPAGTVLTPTTPIVGITDIITSQTLIEGADLETVAKLRQRILDYLRRRPQGGAIADYIAWALEVSGIVKCFVVRSLPGVVTLYPLIDAADRVPSMDKCNEVKTYVETRKPMCADIVVYRAYERSFDLAISGLLPDTSAMRYKLVDTLTEYFLSRYPWQYPDEAAPTHTISLSGIYSEAAKIGIQNLVVEMTEGGGGSISHTFLDIGYIAKLGVVTWI